MVKPMLEDDPRGHRLLAELRRGGPLSRQELHGRLGLRPNTVTELAERLVRLGTVRECAAVPSGPGRPRVPLEIDPAARCVLGVSLEAGHASATRLNLLGDPLGGGVRRKASGADVVRVASELMAEALDERVLAVGLSATGFIDRQRQSLLLSSATGGAGPVSLDPLYEAAGRWPVFLDNDLQAMAIRWMMGHETEVDRDILLVSLRDGAIGAAVLVDGKPIRGSVVGGNELGHTRLPVATRRCLCGHTGCLEQVFSSHYLKMHAHDGGPTNLAKALTHYPAPRKSAASRIGAGDPHDQRVREVVGYLAMGIGNAVNLLRPKRLVLASGLVRLTPFIDDLQRRIRAAMLGTLREHTRIDLWEQPATAFAESAGWLALASIYHPEITGPPSATR